MNKKMAELYALFSVIKLDTTPITYFQDKFKNSYSTNKETISYDELDYSFKELKLLPRNAQFPVIKQGGFERKFVTPDLVKGTVVLTPDELSKMQAGQAEIYVNGEKVDNSKIITERKLSVLKKSYIRTKELIASEVYLTGKVTPEESDTPITLFELKEENKQFTKATDSWQVLLLDLISKYVKENKIAPNLIEIGIDIFNAILNDEKMAKIVEAYKTVSINASDNVYPTLNFLNYKIVVLPNAEKLKGEPIDTSKKIILSNNNELTSAYVGLAVATDDDNIKIIESEMVISEHLNKPLATKEWNLQSGYLPLVPLPSRIKVYNVTIK